MRTYKRKTNRGSTSKDVIDRACQQVIFDKKSINSTAKQFAIPYKTLQRHVVNMTKKIEKNPELSKSESTYNVTTALATKEIDKYLVMRKSLL
ncbi:unnamed protein product [Euphydryas editha]|uniref:HTH psq-type domain-containing protein n=1 Tax=Euphydryas editha TaxID=104508 RepID=A0AAU9VBP5_EUPED|nr:unnamed protein product [Euphydryas editha]